MSHADIVRETPNGSTGIRSGWRRDPDAAMLVGWMQLSCENSSRH